MREGMDYGFHSQNLHKYPKGCHSMDKVGKLMGFSTKRPSLKEKTHLMGCVSMGGGLWMEKSPNAVLNGTILSVLEGGWIQVCAGGRCGQVR